MQALQSYELRRGMSAFADGSAWEMKRAAFILIVVAVVVGLGAAGLHCGGSSESPMVERVRSEISSGRQELRNSQAENLEALARDMRAMAQRYLKQGDKKKAQRAIGAAQELDRKILELRNERQ